MLTNDLNHTFRPFSDTDYHSWYNPGEDFVHLKLSIMKLDGSRTNAQIFLSPRLDQVLRGSKGLHLPEYKRDIALTKYVASVTNMIENKIAFIIEHYKMKKLFVATLVAMCSNSVVEYDTESFNKVVFMHTVEDYSCLVNVMIGKFIYYVCFYAAKYCLILF